jgi:hypothetical protein
MQLKMLGALTAVAVMLSSAAQAAPIYGTAVTGADLASSRDETGGGLTTGGDYAQDNLNQSISWTIVDQGGGVWSYSYTLSGFAGPALSHWILDLTDDCIETANQRSCVNTNWPDLEFGDFAGGSGNPGMPNNIVGVKFDETGDLFDETGGTGTFTFLSSRAPVWGDVYMKGGSDSFAYNTGLETINRGSENSNFFIARPNGAVPEPATLILFGLGLMGGAARMRRKSR